MTQKKHLFQHCVGILNTRVSEALAAMEDAQASANGETKSSAGDKYETGRAMAHLDKERHTRRHAAAVDALHRLHTVSTEPTEDIEEGALIHTNRGIFYLAVGLGEVEIDGAIVQVISPESPLGEVLMEMDVGDSEIFRGQTLHVTAVE